MCVRACEWASARRVPASVPGCISRQLIAFREDTSRQQCSNPRVSSSRQEIAADPPPILPPRCLPTPFPICPEELIVYISKVAVQRPFLFVRCEEVRKQSPCACKLHSFRTVSFASLKKKIVQRGRCGRGGCRQEVRPEDSSIEKGDRS